MSKQENIIQHAVEPHLLIPDLLGGDGRKRDEYDSISTVTRRALISLVFQHNVSIRRASNYLGIKYSTGKTLVQ